MITFGHFKISPCTAVCFTQAGVGGPYARLPGLHSPCFCSEIPCWLHHTLDPTHARTNTDRSAIATPCVMLEGNFLCVGTAQEAGGGYLAIQRSVALGLLGRAPSFLEMQVTTGLPFSCSRLLSSPSARTKGGCLVSLREATKKVSGPGEPAPPAEAIFKRLPKPPCPWFQTLGAMPVRSSQWWTPRHAGKEENAEKRDPSLSLQLLVAEALR